MKLKPLFLILLCVICFDVHAQKIFGNEWVKSGQPYYKVVIWQNGIYRISEDVFVSAGINTSAIDPRNIQVFQFGKELPVFVSGEDDGKLDAADYLEFFAQRNDGALDKGLYADSNNFHNPYVSSISDTACVYITWGNSPSTLHITPYSNTNFGAFTPETSYLHTEVQRFDFAYYFGLPILSEYNYHSSEYLAGEGMGSARFGKNLGELNFPLKTRGYVNNGTPPVLSFRLSGTSDFADVNPDHHHLVRTSTDNATFTTVFDTIYEGYTSFIKSISLPPASITTDNLFVKFTNIDNLSSAVDGGSVAYTTLTYPKNFDLNASGYAELQVKSTTVATDVFLQFSNYSGNAPVLFDLTSGKRVAGNFSAGQWRFLYPKGNGSARLVLCDTSMVKKITSMEPAPMLIVDTLQNYEFLIVTHKKILAKATEYAQYRAQKYKVLLVTTDQLENTFSFGTRHPLAIRYFADYLLTKLDSAPKYLLLLGRGLQHDYVRLPQHNWLNLVPQLGVPSSDVMFTSGLNGTSVNEPAIATARIPALTNQEVDHFLQKLIFMETRSDSILHWRKNILHLGGGDGISQQWQIASNLQAIQQIAEGNYFGARVSSFFKSTTSPVELNLKQKIIDAINGGLGFVTFYGHGSLNILDIDIGNHNDLLNKDKYPVMYFNGCNVGNISADLNGGVSQVGINGAAYILSKDKGAIAWMAHSNTSLISNLSQQTSQLYTRYFNSSYGSSIAVALKDMLRITAVQGDEIGKCHSHQLILLGDPAYRHYLPQQADYQISNADVYITPGNVSATSDSFAVAVIVRNTGKATTDSVQVRVTRQLPSGANVVYDVRSYAPVHNMDTLFYYIRSKDASTAGLNQFTVDVDATQRVDELSETNNTATISFFMPGNSLLLLNPYNYSIQSSTAITFKVQAQNLFTTSAQMIFEMDTTPFCNPSSAYYKTSGVLSTNGALGRWTVNLSDKDSMVYHWRVRLNLPANEGGNWQYGSFTYIRNGKTGFMLSDYFQQQAVSGKDMYLDTLTRTWNFSLTEEIIDVLTARWRHAGLGIKTATSQYLTPFAFNCVGSGLLVIVFDKRSFSYDLEHKYPFNCPFVVTFNQNNPSSKVFYYSFTPSQLSEQDKFAAFIDSIETGDYVAVMSRYEAKPSVWTEKMYSAFEKLGSAQIRSFINDSMAIAFTGKKGAPAGSAAEQIIYNPYFGTGSTVNNADTILAKTRYVAKGNWYEGAMSSQLIGPAKSWDKVFWSFNTQAGEVKDSITTEVFVKAMNGSDSLVLSISGKDSADISFLNAATYPFVTLRTFVHDQLYRTPPKFKYWMVHYEPVPEGFVNTRVSFSAPVPNVEEGDNLSLACTFENISKQSFDSLLVEYSFTNASRQVVRKEQVRLRSLAAEDTISVQYNVNTTGLTGPHTFSVSFNPAHDQREFTLANNTLLFPVQIKRDVQNPLVDVYFDGIRILNGDIVSPTPQITVVAKDENRFLKIKDTTSLTLLYKSPQTGMYEQVSFSSPEVTFIPADDTKNEARIIYRPARLADGLHELRVFVRDATGNPAGNKPYTVKFNVVNESSITHFVPYPNPFTTSMRFVFTLTGADIPDNIRIKIMTVTGKVVREISASELGPLRIGNNVSQFVWDGTDQFGDRLANGVYLYQVQVRYKGEQVKHRNSSLDSYFKSDTGKIYLMR